MDPEGLPSSPVRPTAFALIVAAPTAQPALQAMLHRENFDSLSVDEPYAALVELLAKPLVYRAVVLSLHGLYREELTVIKTIRAKLPHVSVWLAHTDGRQAALAEAMRLGASGLLSEEGLHAFSDDEPTTSELAKLSSLAATQANTERTGIVEALTTDERAHEPDEIPDESEPILSADELRALLADSGTWPSSASESES
ncbi:MAG: hypothetical protein QM770_10625 [Tepidisphaeraceae bacterium]